MKNVIQGLVFLAMSLLSLKSKGQQTKLKSSYELSNSNQWLPIPGGFASFVQFDYNNDGRDDVVLFEGYDINKTYTWPGPSFYKNTTNGLIKDFVSLDNTKLFAGKELVGDFNNDGFVDAFLLTGMDPAGCSNCKDPVFSLYTMKNVSGYNFKVDSVNYKGVWRTGTSADIDNDGDLDVVAFSTHHEYSGDILNRILLNDGKGNFSYKASNIDSIGWVDRAELIDMNNDGFVDLLMNDVYSPLNVYSNRFRILWNNKKGEFHQDRSVTIKIPNDLYVLDINVLDVNGDGKKEIILPMNDVAGKWKILMYQTFDDINYTEVSENLIQKNFDNSLFLWDEPLAIYDLDNNGLTDIVLNDKSKKVRWEWNGTLFSRKLETNDFDNDGISEIIDNCKLMYNPKQEDLDNSGVGDVCEFSPILLRKSISILEDVSLGYEELMSKFIQDSIKPYISFGDGTYKTFFETSTTKFKLIKSLKEATVEVFKLPFNYKKDGVSFIDTLSIYILRYTNWTKNTGKIQNGYIPYYYEGFSNGMTGTDNVKFGPFGISTPANQATILIQDLDGNGMNDIIGQSGMIWYPPISDTSKVKDMPNIQRIGIPAYLKFDSAFNATFYHENYRNPDVLLHQPDFHYQVDLNKDGKNEIINLGEHYHTELLDGQNPLGPKNILGKQILKYLGMLQNRDYNLQSEGKLSRYYTVENGRLVDKKDNYNYENLNAFQNQSPNISNSKFVSIFGSAFGDIDNDGDIDYIQSVRSEGDYIDILINDGIGNFSINRQNPEQYGYSTGPEGKNMLIDINGDGFLDYFFGGNKQMANSNQNEGFLGYVLNNKKGGFLVESMTNIGNFGSTAVAPKYMFVTDLDHDKNNEIIIYRSTGLGSNGNGIQGQDFVNDLLILSINSGVITNNTDKFIDTLSKSKMFAQKSFLFFEDIDGDKIKDLFISYQIDSAIAKFYSPFTGYWEKNYNGFSYFKGSKEGKFKYTRLGKFQLEDGFAKWYSPTEFSGVLSNDFQVADLENDGTSELLHLPTGKGSLIIFKLYDCPKPVISPIKTIICGPDSVNVKIINRDPSAKYTWYINNDSVSKASDSIFIKKEGYLKLKMTDSLGCSKFSDSVFLKSLALPTTPSISRDTANYLVSSGGISNTWYKDGLVIADTTQRFKPAAPGSYTTKTNQNSCISAMSNPYYYLITDIINLSNGDFIKLAPNPIVNKVNLDFSIKGYQRLNFDVFEMTTGNRVYSRQGLSAGMPIFLGELSPGNYIIKISSNDNKIRQQFKILKM